MSTPGPPPAEATQRIVAILEPALKPVTFGQLKKAAHLDNAGTTRALEAAINQGAVFRWPDYRRSQYFWRQSPMETARQAVLTIASGEAYSRSRLAERARRTIPGFSIKEMNRIVSDLISTRELQQVPAFTTGKLLIRAGAAAAYETTARKFIAEKFRKAGLDRVSVPAPGSAGAGERGAEPHDAETRILEAIRSLEPVPGVPVSTQRLRNHLKTMDKHDFDRAAIRLRDAGKIFLSLHHDAHNLPQAQRDQLVDSDDGNFHVALAVRR
jgi:hypothetical protein